MTASIMVDSSAALAVVARKGNGKLRRVRVGPLWVQQVAADGGLKNHKVKGEENPSDACTKHLAGGTPEEASRARGTVPKVGASARVAPRAACADCAGRSAHLDPQHGSLTWLWSSSRLLRKNISMIAWLRSMAALTTIEARISSLEAEFSTIKIQMKSQFKDLDAQKADSFHREYKRPHTETNVRHIYKIGVRTR